MNALAKVLSSQKTRYLLLFCLLAVEIPLTLRRPITSDCVLFDLEWRTILNGGVLYRDIFQTNPPGTLWLHALVRSVGGWSSEALRAFDLLMIGGSIICLANWVRRFGRDQIAAWWLSIFLIWLYGFQSIWVQCQRDPWMLAFSLFAMEFRWRRNSRFDGSDEEVNRVAWGSTIAEALCWSMAVWIKPFVFIPALAVWGWDQFHTQSKSARRRHIKETCVLLATGGLAGLVGIIWMIQTGCWTHFVETNTQWNVDYFDTRRINWQTLLAMAYHYIPWYFTLFVSIPVACMWLATNVESTDSEETAAKKLFGCFFLAWVLQAMVLQRWHAYVQLPCLFLATTVLAGEVLVTRAKLWKPTLISGILLTLYFSPLARFEQIGAWRHCLTSEVSPELRMVLRGPLDRVYPGAADLPQLLEVADYLRGRDVKDGEVCGYAYSTMPLYQMLKIEPPCRFICPRIYALAFFPDRRHEIAALLEKSNQRFVVTDLVIDGMSEVKANAIGPAGRHAVPPAYPEDVPPNVYPWSHPVVFRSGRYLVHEIRGPMGEFTSERYW